MEAEAVSQQRIKDMGFNPNVTPHAENLTKWTLETYDTLEVLENDLRGNVWNEDTGKWEKKYTAYINDDGVNAIMGYIRGHVSKTLLLGNIDAEMKDTICKEVCEDVIKFIQFNYKKYEIDINNWDLVLNMIDHVVEIFLSRALLGGERERLNQTQKFHEVVTHKAEEEQKKKAWFGANPFTQA
jgi:hypothetical protein|tara:strand:- start:384 stop:935 length:552 start_codon:yes stop_codon:yes gene_type:complete